MWEGVEEGIWETMSEIRKELEPPKKRLGERGRGRRVCTIYS